MGETVLEKGDKSEVTHVLACGRCPRAFCNCKDVSSALLPCIKELFTQMVTVCLGFLLGEDKLQGKNIGPDQHDVP